MTGLLLDDVRNNEDCFMMTGHHEYLNVDWVVVKDILSFKQYILANGIPEIISFDNDLTDEHYKHLIETGDFNFDLFDNTGYHCAEWVLEFITRHGTITPKFMVHTMNPIAKFKILKLIEEWKKIQ